MTCQIPGAIGPVPTSTSTDQVPARSCMCVYVAVCVLCAYLGVCVSSPPRHLSLCVCVCVHDVQMLQDEAIAQMINDELFMEQLRADPQFSRYLGAGVRVYPSTCL